MFANPSNLIRTAVLCAGGLLAACGGRLEGQVDNVDELLAATAEGDFAAAVDLGHAAWLERGQEDRVLEAIAAWESALTIGSDEGVDRAEALSTLYTSIAMANFWLGHGHLTYLEDNRDNRPTILAAFEAGMEAAQRALAIRNPQWNASLQAGNSAEDSVDLLTLSDVPAAYWLAVNTGKVAQLSGMMTGLRLKDEINALMTRVSELDSTFYYNGPDRYFGAYKTRLPIGNPDMDAARAHFESAVEGAPEFLESRVVFVEEWAMREDDHELAVEQLHAVLAFDLESAPEILPENENAQRRARALLAQLSEMNH
jgi:tetratricopeptide (TPR) repeat protein